ncbi:hypothetical protein LPU83_pLPU83c_0024 (plasmid) [Rhizobium favelukesii]|uniref:HTH marR-type domain-containing protein n=1 Tax=Rhizobium favelukesii TaxID=348824 RepID=W6S2E5_9HYPH|nr:hypothetical protein LPU83_pLPU83c_0024 [Rhizobium favelukesii]
MRQSPRRGSPRAADLSRSLGIDASTIAANLKPLMRQELVFAPVDVTDRRARRLFLTVAGSERLERGIKQLQEYEGGLASECDGNTDHLASVRLSAVWQKHAFK